MSYATLYRRTRRITKEWEPRGGERTARRGQRAKSFSTRSSRNSARQRFEHASSSSSLSDVLHVLHAAATRTKGGDALLFSTAFSAGIARVAREA